MVLARLSPAQLQVQRVPLGPRALPPPPAKRPEKARSPLAGPMSRPRSRPRLLQPLPCHPRSLRFPPPRFPPPQCPPGALFWLRIPASNTPRQASSISLSSPPKPTVSPRAPACSPGAPFTRSTSTSAVPRSGSFSTASPPERPTAPRSPGRCPARQPVTPGGTLPPRHLPPARQKAPRCDLRHRPRLPRNHRTPRGPPRPRTPRRRTRARYPACPPAVGVPSRRSGRSACAGRSPPGYPRRVTTAPAPPPPA